MDAAIRSLDAILASDEFELVEDIPLFDLHDEYDERKLVDGKPNPNLGKLVRRFDKKRLEAIADKCNERLKSGDLSPIGLGHTIPGAKEVDQPDIVGYVGPYRVGVFGPKEKLGVLSSFYMKKQVELPDGQGGKKVISGKDVLKTFPRRSVELWFKDNMIDWVALLKRTPERDLGLTAYQRTESLADGKIRYSMEDYQNPTHLPDARGKDPSAEEVDELTPDEKKMAERFWKHYTMSNPGLDEACKKYAAFLSPTNGWLPTPNAKEQPMTPEEVGRFQKDHDELNKKLEAVQKECESLKAKNAELEGNVARQARLTRYEKQLVELCDKERVVMDIQEELIEHADDAPERFEKFLEKAKRTYRKVEEDGDPTVGRFVKTDDPADPNNISEAKAARVYQKIRETGKSYEECLKLVK